MDLIRHLFGGMKSLILITLIVIVIAVSCFFILQWMKRSRAIIPTEEDRFQTIAAPADGADSEVSQDIIQSLTAPEKGEVSNNIIKNLTAPK